MYVKSILFILFISLSALSVAEPPNIYIKASYSTSSIEYKLVDDNRISQEFAVAGIELSVLDSMRLYYKKSLDSFDYYEFVMEFSSQNKPLYKSILTNLFVDYRYYSYQIKESPVKLLILPVGIRFLLPLEKIHFTLDYSISLFEAYGSFHFSPNEYYRLRVGMVYPITKDVEVAFDFERNDRNFSATYGDDFNPTYIVDDKFSISAIYRF